MRRTLLLVTVLATVAGLIVGCSLFKTGCAQLTGVALTACEVQNFVTDIEAAVPPAFATINTHVAAFNPTIQAQVTNIEAKWPALKTSLDGLSTAIAAGQNANWAAVLGDGLAFYVELGAVYADVYVGHSLPGLPSAPAVQTAVTAAKAAAPK